MGFLGVLRLGLVLADEGRDEALGKQLLDLLADVADRFGNDVDAVGSHVGDKADGLAADIDAFIKTLGDLHGLLGRKAQLARGLLLQRRGGEGGERIALHTLLVDRADAEVAALDRRLDGAGVFLIGDVEFLERLAGDRDETGLQFLVLGGRQ